MNETLAKFWLFATHWTELDVFETEEELNDEIELLHRQNLPTKVRERTNKEGKEELVLYVKQADRDYARYCTGWRPGMRNRRQEHSKKEHANACSFLRYEICASGNDEIITALESSHAVGRFIGG